MNDETMVGKISDAAGLMVSAHNVGVGGWVDKAPSMTWHNVRQ
jgi:hypothetical protein